MARAAVRRFETRPRSVDAGLVSPGAQGRQVVMRDRSIAHNYPDVVEARTSRERRVLHITACTYGLEPLKLPSLVATECTTGRS